jgi:hypothetical protein
MRQVKGEKTKHEKREGMQLYDERRKFRYWHRYAGTHTHSCTHAHAQAHMNYLQ